MWIKYNVLINLHKVLWLLLEYIKYLAIEARQFFHSFVIGRIWKATYLFIKYKCMLMTELIWRSASESSQEKEEYYIEHSS